MSIRITDLDKNIFGLLFFMAILSACSEKTEKEKLIERTSVAELSNLDSFITQEIVWATTKKEQQYFDRLAEEQLPPYHIDTLDELSLGLRIYVVHTLGGNIRFLLLEDGLNHHLSILPMNNYNSVIKQLSGGEKNIYKEVFALQNKDMLGLESFVNQSAVIQQQGLSLSLTDSLFSCYFNYKNDREIADTLTLKRVHDLSELEKVKQHFFSSRAREDQALFEFLKDMLSLEREKSLQIKYAAADLKTGALVYYDQHLIHLIVVTENKNPRFKHRRYTIDYTVF